MGSGRRLVVVGDQTFDVTLTLYGGELKPPSRTGSRGGLAGGGSRPSPPTSGAAGYAADAGLIPATAVAVTAIVWGDEWRGFDVSPRAQRPEGDLEALIASLDVEDLRAIVSKAAEHHEEVAGAVRLTASRASGDLRQLRAEIDRGLRAGRFLGYYESRGWAHEAQPIVEEIRNAVRSSPSAELVVLIERAIGRVVKVILHADDSDGLIGDVARKLLDLHAEACDAGVADPVKLARWMVKFRFDDQDFFEADPVRYAKALGETGLAAFRREVEHHRKAGAGDSFALKYAEERLAVLDGDTAAIVRLLGGDLSVPYQFIRIAEAMEELGRDEDVLEWATRGVAKTSGWQVAQLYDLAVRVHARRGEHEEVLRLRREQHHRMPSSSTYGLLRAASETCGVWETERPGARVVLAEHDLGGFVDVLLADGEPDAAWQMPGEHPGWEPGAQRWMRLAEAREPSAPGDALDVYLRLADVELETTGRASYVRAVAILENGARAANAADRQGEFAEHLTALREAHRRRPTFIKILDHARLG